ncbi:MAG: metallophosphoesterase [Crocinitomicaceae bacterium]|nr:metallophosphoesterase [Crocinitomicaceae bacterium]MBK8925535.1 metallophosphoesterase [Crocinitomicaceae bacterium]
MLCFSNKVSPFNKLSPSIDSTGNYTFIVSGHFYGDGTNKSGYPANTLLANISWINHESNADFMVCLGDLFMDIKNDIPKYEMSLFKTLQIPLYNAVGNHDLTDNIYQQNYGETFYKFQIENSLHVILDTELNDGDISDEQLEFLRTTCEEIKENKYREVFFYAHRTIWKDHYPEMEGLFADNTQSITKTNFADEVLPLLLSISSSTKVYWFAGSLGDAPASFFYFEDQKSDITYIATAIRAMLRDALLLVHVSEDGVRFETKSLTMQNVNDLSSYDLSFWKQTSAEEPFNYRLIPLYIKNTFLSRYFWYGTTFALLIIGSIWLLRRIRNR